MPEGAGLDAAADRAADDAAQDITLGVARGTYGLDDEMGRRRGASFRMRVRYAADRGRFLIEEWLNDTWVEQRETESEFAAAGLLSFQARKHALVDRSANAIVRTSWTGMPH